MDGTAMRVRPHLDPSIQQPWQLKFVLSVTIVPMDWKSLVLLQSIRIKSGKLLVFRVQLATNAHLLPYQSAVSLTIACSVKQHQKCAISANISRKLLLHLSLIARNAPLVTSVIVPAILVPLVLILTFQVAAMPNVPWMVCPNMTCVLKECIVIKARTVLSCQLLLLDILEKG